MNTIKERWRSFICEGLNVLAKQQDPQSQQFDSHEIIVEVPPRPDFGDLAFPLFEYARRLRRNPALIAQQLLEVLTHQQLDSQQAGDLEQRGPYLNVRLDREQVTEEILGEIETRLADYGHTRVLEGRRILVEFSCPNTNKPLHLGHLRNDAIGESLAKILQANGAEVVKVNLINDRGIHICQSMVAYQKYADERTPQSEAVKGDHFVGSYYVMFSSWADQDPRAHELAHAALMKWEQEDAATVRLWKKMNRWATEGIMQTYRRTGVSFDEVYYESNTYLLGRQLVVQGLERGIFYREDDGSVWIDLSEWDLDKKVILRSDGTSLYLTQDIGTAVQRFEDWHFDKMIYVVASEQRYHFQVLFQVLTLLGYEWAQKLSHLAYGMVNLPEGKMKSREGTVVDADDLLDELEDLAKQEVKEREATLEDLTATAQQVVLAAINYYLLQPSPHKDIVFNSEESISFNGNSGPYLQYSGARITSMISKFEQRSERYRGGHYSARLLGLDQEWEIVKLLASFPDRVEAAAEELNPSIVAGYLHELTKAYSRYYQEYPVLHNEDANLVISRILLSRCVRQVLMNGFSLIGIPFLEQM